MSEFLSKEEISLLTGKKTRKAQIGWLARNGWRYVENGAGCPVVSRLYCRQRMTDDIPTAQDDEMPNFSAIA